MRLALSARIARRGGFTVDVAEELDVESLGLVGPSGSGKSTLLDAIAGFEPVARVAIDGVDLTPLGPERRRIGHVAQDPLLFPHLSVRANLLYSPHAGGLGDVPAALAIDHLLDRMPRNLSGGERRRVALGRAILSRPRLLLLDEPFGGLDETRRREAMALLAHVRQRYRIPMILVSHLPDEIVGLTDQAIRLEAGRVVRRGPTLAVLRAGETRIDNYLVGRVVDEGHVAIGEAVLAAPVPAGVRGEVRLACFAHDVVLATAPPGALSARNVLRTRIASRNDLAGSVLLELAEPRMRAILTPEAASALALVPGSEVFAIIKATSIAYLGAA